MAFGCVNENGCTAMFWKNKTHERERKIPKQGTRGFPSLCWLCYCCHGYRGDLCLSEHTLSKACHNRVRRSKIQIIKLSLFFEVSRVYLLLGSVLKSMCRLSLHVSFVLCVHLVTLEQSRNASVTQFAGKRAGSKEPLPPIGLGVYFSETAGLQAHRRSRYRWHYVVVTCFSLFIKL